MPNVDRLSTLAGLAGVLARIFACVLAAFAAGAGTGGFLVFTHFDFGYCVGNGNLRRRKRGRGIGELREGRLDVVRCSDVEFADSSFRGEMMKMEVGLRS